MVMRKLVFQAIRATALGGVWPYSSDQCRNVVRKSPRSGYDPNGARFFLEVIGRHNELAGRKENNSVLEIERLHAYVVHHCSGETSAVRDIPTQGFNGTSSSPGRLDPPGHRNMTARTLRRPRTTFLDWLRSSSAWRGFRGLNQSQGEARLGQRERMMPSGSSRHAFYHAEMA